MEVNMWPAAASIAVLGLVACVGLISRRSGNTVDNGVADDRWFVITQWMARNEKWKDKDAEWSNGVNEFIEYMTGALDKLKEQASKSAGQLVEIKEAVSPKLGKGMMLPDSYSRAAQGGDGLVWKPMQPTEPGLYWFSGVYEWNGESLFAKVSPFVVYECGKFGHLDMNGYISEYAVDCPVTFKGWWTKMETPEFKGA